MAAKKKSVKSKTKTKTKAKRKYTRRAPVTASVMAPALTLKEKRREMVKGAYLHGFHEGKAVASSSIMAGLGIDVAQLHKLQAILGDVRDLAPEGSF